MMKIICNFTGLLSNAALLLAASVVRLISVKKISQKLPDDHGIERNGESYFFDSFSLRKTNCPRSALHIHR